MQTPGSKSGSMSQGVHPTIPNVPHMAPPLNSGPNSIPFANNPNNSTFPNAIPHPFSHMANSGNDYYGKSVPLPNRTYESFNGPPMYPQSNGFPLPSTGATCGSSNNANVMPGYMNPNIMKYYKDVSLNESQKMTPSGMISHPNPMMPMPYMNNFSRENKNHMEKGGTTLTGGGTSAANVWAEMVAKNGRKFYYNTVTRCSKWEKPDELKTPEEIKISQKTKWKEYTCGDGRKYWYHEEKNLSVWEEPEEIKLIRAECAKELSEERTNENTASLNVRNNIAATVAMDAGTIPNKDKGKTKDSGGPIMEAMPPMFPFPFGPMMGGPMRLAEPNHVREAIQKGNKKKGTADQTKKQEDGQKNNAKPFADKHEARIHLKKLFEEKITNPKITWDNAMKLLETHPLWPSFSILTRGEMRQMYSEYASTAIKRVAENERRKRQKSREIIFQTLLNWSKLDEKTTYEEFAKEFHNKEWWDWITERERDEILEDFIDDYKSTFRENKKKKRKIAMEHLKEKFQKYANDKENPLKWEEIKIRFEKDEDFRALHKLDALATWESFYEKYHLQEKEKLKKKVYRVFRKKRDAFAELLKEYHEQNVLNVKTEWVFFVTKIYKDERYTDLLGNPGSTPRILFDEFIKSLQHKYLKHKVYLKKACREKKFEMKEDTSLDQFLECFKTYQTKYEIPDIHMNFIYQSMQKKRIEQKKKEQKHIKKVANFLIKNKELKPNMTYEKVISIIKGLSKWENVCSLCPKKEQKIAAYNLWKTHVQHKSKQSESGSDLSDYERKKLKKNKIKTPRGYQHVEEKRSQSNVDRDNGGNKNTDCYDQNDQTENKKDNEHGIASSSSSHQKGDKESEEVQSDSSSHTIESLRTIENVE